MNKNVKFLTMLAAVAALTACGNGHTPSESSSQAPESQNTPGKRVLGGNNAGWEADARNAVQGYYIQTEFTEEEWTEARSLYQMHTNSDVSCVAVNTLILRNNTYAKRDATPWEYEPGQRYELTKEFRDTQIGCYFWATFYGTYTFEGNQVTLKSPERFSYCFDGGAGKPKASMVASNGCYLTGEETTNPAQDWIDGDVINAFNGGILNYRHNSGHDDMVVTIDQQYFTFTNNKYDDEGNVIPVTEVPHREVADDYNYNGNNAGWEADARTVGQGFYTMTDFSEEDWTEARSLYQMHTNSDVSCVAHNELVLRNNTYAKRDATPWEYEPGQRYELTKQFRDTQIGCYFWATFYGTYTIEGNKAVLSEPERFSYVFDGGAGKPKASMVASNGFYLTGEETTNPAQDWIDGQVINSFNGNIINYRHNSGHEAMTVTLDQNNFKFSIDPITE